jgi:GNAT superfamily N-acetyltransferase
MADLGVSGIAIVAGAAVHRDALRPIVEHWVRGRVSGRLLRHEVETIVNSIGSPATWHAVAIETPTVLGVMGLTLPGADVLTYALTKRPGEIVHAFVDATCARRGVGSLLARSIEDRAMAIGLTELLVRSGPRYEASGWPFWTARYGEPVAIERADRGGTAIWRKLVV